MFAKSIVLSDAFLDMPMSARCLYFTLSMMADDDGFVGSPKAIMRQCGASQDDMNVLLSKRYVLGFDTGVIVIKHWRINNYLREDRRKDTTYVEEMETLAIDQKGAYTEACQPIANQLPTNCQPSDSQLTGKCQPSIDKNSIDKNSINKSARFQKPTVEEIRSYCLERKNGIDPETFYNYYESKGWVIGKNGKMKDWKAAVRTWEKRSKPEKKNKFDNFEGRKYDFERLEEDAYGP